MRTQNFSAVQSALAQIKGISFVSIIGYNNQLGETQNQLINVGYSLEKAKNDDFEYLMSLNFSGKDAVLETARIELIKAHKIASYIKFYGGDRDFAYIAGMVSQFLVNCETSADINCTPKEVQTAFNRSKGQKDAYINLDNGFKFNPETNEYYVFGFQVRDKVVTEKAEIEKADTRSALTKAKDSLRAKMKSGKFRQFKISEINTLKAMGETIVVNE
jgi:hypothetical protein